MTFTEADKGPEIPVLERIEREVLIIETGGRESVRHEAGNSYPLKSESQSGPAPLEERRQAMIVCVGCQREMRCDKNGVGANYGHGHVYPADRYKCPVCGTMILHTNHNAIFDPNLKTQSEYLNMREKGVDYDHQTQDR